MLTDVNLAAIDAASPADDPVATLDRNKDDGTRPLGPADYIRFRIDDQVAFIATVFGATTPGARACAG